MDQTNNAPWFADDQKDFVTTKGWQTPADAIKSYQNLETLFGADKAGRTVILPKDEKDLDGWKNYRTKLGVPEAPDAYELPIPEGDPGEFAKLASNWMYKAGIPKSAAQAIAKEWNEHFSTEMKRMEEADKQRVAKEESDLKGEWGKEFDSKYELTLRAFREYGTKAGFNEQDVEAIKSAIGGPKLAKLMSALGQNLTEDNFFTADAGSQFTGTKADAETKLNELRIKRAAGEISFETWMAEAEKLQHKAYG